MLVVVYIYSLYLVYYVLLAYTVYMSSEIPSQDAQQWNTPDVWEARMLVQIKMHAQVQYTLVKYAAVLCMQTMIHTAAD